MRKILLIALLFFTSIIIGYSQRKETKVFVTESKIALATMYVSKTPVEVYSVLKHDIEIYLQTLNKNLNRYFNQIPEAFLWDYVPKKDRLLLKPLYLSVEDSIHKRFRYDKEIARLEDIRIQQQRDSIKLSREKAIRLHQDSIKALQELEKRKIEAIKDSIRTNDPDFRVTEGKGNGAFSDAPNFLAQIFTSNATVESIVATFPNYTAHYANDQYTDRRQRSYTITNGKKQYYDITLEYDAKTRKVKTIIIDDPYTDKFKQKLLNAGYSWDKGSSMTATAFGHGYYSYWEKKGSWICFVIKDRTIKVFRINRK